MRRAGRHPQTGGDSGHAGGQDARARGGVRWWRPALVAVLALSALAAGDASSGARFQRLGAQLICTCGCTQGALVCNHVGCPVVTQMRAELAARAATNDSDDLVLQSFVQEYGTQVLAVPSTHGFNLLAWVMPWLAAGVGLLLVLGVARRWRRPAVVASPAPAAADERARIRHEIDEEIGREWS